MAYELVDAPPGRYELVDHPPIKLGAEALPDTVAAYAGDYHPATQLLAGVGGALGDISTRLGQLWAYGSRGGPNVPAPDLTQQQKTDLEANQALYKESPMAMLGNIGTKLGLTAPAAGPVYGAATNVASKILPSWLQFAAPAAGGAAVGAGVPAVTEPNANLTQGAIGGAVADAATRGLSRVVQPITQSPAVQNLLSRDVVPTIGQAAGGMANRIEEKLMSVPFVGDVIGAARNRARNEAGTAGINLQMPKGMEVSQPGTAGVEQARANLSQGYKDLYGNTSIGRDPQLLQDLDNALQKPIIPLSQEYKKAYDKIVKTTILDRLPAGATFPTGEVKKQIESDLGAKIRELGPMPSGQDLALKSVLEEARTAVRNLANRGAGVDQAQRTALDRGWANMKDMETAASRAEVNKGVPTPLQIINAAKEGSKLEKFGRDAQEVMGNRVPNSGTTDRALMALILGGLGAGASKTETYQQTPI